MVGTHHKTGTVLLELILQDLAKSIEGGAFHKPAWKDCKLPRNHSRSHAAATDSYFSTSSSPIGLPPLSAFGLPAVAATPSPVPVLRTFCVDEHAKSLPSSKPSSSSSSSSSATPLLLASPPRWWAVAPFVHVVRDPLEVCASSYQYALRANESWLRLPREALGGKSYQQYYRTRPLRDGLRVECRRCVKELRQTANLYESTAALQDVLTIRFEELSEAFDATVRRMLSFAGIGTGDALRGRLRFEKLISMTRRHDLTRRAASTVGARLAGHVSDSSQKDQLRAMLLDPSTGVAAELGELRRRLGYTTPRTLSDGDAGSARRRSWLLATMAKA